MRKIIFAIIVLAVLVIAFKKKAKIRELMNMQFAKAYSSFICPNTKFNGAEDKYFSQTYEDYVLANIFSDIEKGFYVDVGANDPNGESSTKYFYLQGWRGMNFEPLENHYAELLKSRPEDINIKKAVSDKSGSDIFYIPDVGDVYASLKPEVETAEISGEPLNKGVNKVNVVITTLTEEFEKYNISNIDFIKIDVEGYEHKVVEGLDFKTYRPKVVVLEYRSPTDQHGYLLFDPIMFKNDYVLSLDDGLNYYYYRKETPELGDKFAKIERCVKASLVHRKWIPFYEMFKSIRDPK